MECSGFDADFVGLANTCAATFDGVRIFLHGLDSEVGLSTETGADLTFFVFVSGVVGTFDGVPIFLHSLDGVSVLSLSTEPVEDLKMFSVSAALLAHVLCLTSFTLLHLGCKLESAAKLAKLLARFRLVLELDDFCLEDRNMLAFGKVFGAEERPSDMHTATDGFKSLRGDSGIRCNGSDGETDSSASFVLFDGDDASSCISLVSF